MALTPITPIQLFSNNAVSLLASSMTPSSTSLSVMAGMGNLFPQPTGDGSDYFLITLEDMSATVREIIRVQARSGDVFSNILRAQEGTTAHSWTDSAPNDTLVDHRITAETMRLAMLVTTGGGGGPVGTEVWDSNYTLTYSPGHTIVTLPGNYVPNSTRISVGGLRQKRGTDYTETAPNELTLNFVVSAQNITDGSNITVDYTAA